MQTFLLILEASLGTESRSNKILIDDEEESPILGYDYCADTIVKIVKGSIPNFSIGIYGDWGTGKSTLMKLVQKKITEQEKDDTIAWDDLEKKDEQSISKLKKFLMTNYNIHWIENLDLKVDDNKITISDNSNITNNHNKSTNKTLLLSPFQKIRQSISQHPPEKNKRHLLSLDLYTDEKEPKAVLNTDSNTKGEFKVTRDENGRTLMHLEEKKVLTVWFNAWRYEREERYALVALMKTIAYAMGDLEYYQDIKKVLLRGIGIITKGVMRNLATKYIMTEKSWEELEKTLLPRMELLSKADKDTIYFDGLHKIEQEMKNISNRDDHENVRIVVFIDDLDRCSPKTALEVFESIKVFLGINGFIYIVGLSDKTISKLITATYKEFYSDLEIKGEDYIRKIIQIQINLPEWNYNDIENTLIDNLSKKLDKFYKDIVVANKNLISRAVKPNPREVKRFINNFIVAYDIFSQNIEETKIKIKPEELLVVQALIINWNDFYLYISQYMSSKDINLKNEFINEIKGFIGLEHEDRIKKINARKEKKDEPLSHHENRIFEFQGNNDLWDFLTLSKEIIFNIQNWDVYRRAAESTKKSPLGDLDTIYSNDPRELNNKAYSLAKAGRSEQALQFIDKSLEIRPNNPAALDTKGIILDRLGRYQEAIMYFDQAIETDRKPVRLRHKASTLKKLGMYKEAKTLEEEAESRRQVYQQISS